MAKVYRADRLEFPEIEALEAKIRRRAMRAATRVVALKVRALAPDSGNSHRDMKMGVRGKLNRSIKYSVLNRGYKGRVKPTAPHSHLVHDGTKPHAIPAPKGLETVRRAFPLYAGGHAVQHPGARAQPFLVEAERAVRPEVEQVLMEAAVAAAAEVAAGVRG